MQSSNVEPLYRKSYVAADLVQNHPAKLRHPNKKRVYEIACPANCIHTGTLHVSRWNAFPLPGELSRRTEVEIESREDVFGYEPPSPNFVEWYLNFADPNLFFAYGGPAFAQDEIQVAEHPALASLLEALIAEDLPALTMDGREPTPILVANVERRCVVATDANASEGRPDGLYGRQFARAKTPAIDRAVRLITPPKQSNVIAMAAPVGGRGQYTLNEIEFVLTTAFTGFTAATLESKRLFQNEAKKVAVHTGFWGCGAFGGNRVLMALLQIIAASMSGIDRLVFHTVTPDGTAAFSKASKMFVGSVMDRSWLTRLMKMAPSPDAPVRLDQILAKIQTMGFEWGVSDGN